MGKWTKVIVGTLIASSLPVGWYFLSADKAVAACEQFVREGLLSPSAYRRVAARTSDRAIDWAEYLTYRPRAERSQVEKMLFDSAAQGIRTTLVEYDAPNAYGTMIRGVEACEFETRDGRLTDKQPDQTAMLLAQSRAIDRLVPDEKRVERVKGCCILNSAR